MSSEAPSSLPFAWHCFDLSSVLPHAWQDDILHVAHTQSREKVLRPASVTSREESTSLEIPVLTVGGAQVRVSLPWLESLYRTLFVQLGQTLVAEELRPAEDVRVGVNLNVLRGPPMRYECHVDSNPLEGLLYVTTHSPGMGGELVIANDGDVSGTDRVDANATRIYPVAGQLVFFDARHHSHYVRGLLSNDAVRVAVAMNFYTPSCPESARPADLNKHLGIE